MNLKERSMSVTRSLLRTKLVAYSKLREGDEGMFGNRGIAGKRRTMVSATFHIPVIVRFIANTPQLVGIVFVFYVVLVRKVRLFGIN